MIIMRDHRVLPVSGIIRDPTFDDHRQDNRRLDNHRQGETVPVPKHCPSNTVPPRECQMNARIKHRSGALS